MTLGLSSPVEVVTFFEIRDESRVHWPPTQECLGLCARPREVARRHGAEKAEAGVCLFAGNADYWQVQVLPDDARDVTKWHTLVADPI